MSVPEDRNLEELLEAYLDGSLSPEERARFERRMEGDAQLRRDVELERRIDASLRRQFANPPTVPDVLAAKSVGPLDPSLDGAHVAPSATTQVLDRPASLARVVTLAVAASVLWMIVLWQLWPKDKAPYTWRSLQNIYASRVGDGFQADWLCSDARQFADTFLERQQTPLLLHPLAANSMMVGLAYIPGITEQTTTLMCRVDGEPVMVFVDRLADDIRPDRDFARANIDDLHVFRKELAGLAVYELSPHDTPQIMDALYVPEELPPKGTPTLPGLKP